MPNTDLRPATGPSTTHTVSLAYLQPLQDVLHARNSSLEKLMQHAGLRHNAAADAMPAGHYLQLLDAGAALFDDPFFGLHCGEKTRLGAYNVYGMILMSCQDLGEALHQTMRYEELAHDLGRSELLIDGDYAEYRWHSHFPQASRHLAESVFAGIRVFADWFAGQPLPPGELRFLHTAPADCREYLRVFGAIPAFEADCHAVRFPAALLRLPVPNADQSMASMLRQHADTLLQKKRQQTLPDIVRQLRQLFEHQLKSGELKLGDAAAHLQMSTRTLQRKLAEAGTGFQQVLDQTRYELACVYLANQELSLTDIAFLLGYQEQSSFQHAFRSWSGVTPGQYRNQQRHTT